MSDASAEKTPLDWQARFEADDTPWERLAVHPAVEYWVKSGHFSVGQSVYIPGCGRSLEPQHLSQKDLVVTVSDIAPSAIAFQKERLAKTAAGQIQAIEADGLSWRPDEPFDCLYEQTFLCAISPKLRAQYEQMAHDVIKPGGQLLALFMQKEERGGPPYGCDLETMRELFGSERWIWPSDADFPAFGHPGLNDKAEIAVALERI